MNSFNIIIAGRPNVGKSTLFNRLIKKRVAIVDNVPGTTRDYRSSKLNIGEFNCRLFDTAGIDGSCDNHFNKEISFKTRHLLDSADVILFITDARAGLTGNDIEFASDLRRYTSEILLLTNKMETKAAEHGFWDFFSLGIEEPIPISASHGLGIPELLERIEECLKAKNCKFGFSEIKNQKVKKLSKDNHESLSISDTQSSFNRVESKDIKLAIIGRPNVGKSTLFNSILGESRVMTSSEAGTTTDPVNITTRWLGHDFQIVDTAGIRRAVKVNKGIEDFSVKKAFEVIKYAEIVLVLLDNERALDSQDLRIISFAYKEGRGLVLAVNKWDKELDKKEKLSKLKDKIVSSLPQFEDLPLITISARKNEGITLLKKTILQAYKNWTKRIPTAKLNQWLSFKLLDHPPPMIRGRRIKLKYITQVKARPPTFILFSSHHCELPESYQRFLINGLRRDFKLFNVAIRLNIRVGDNPYSVK
ncbi:MAG: ribosome biogenesis GTPase Der [Paracoccaceae bacterium]